MVSLVVVLGLVGLALYERFSAEVPPGVRVAVALATADVEERDGVYDVPFEVTNRGGEPATDVTIHFAVRRGELVLEESETVVRFLPISGAAAGALPTSFDPAAHDFTARVGTFLEP